MKLLIALVFGFSSSALAQTTPDLRSAIFQLNQANQTLSLDQKDYETIYRTDQLPDTCYRDEVQGTKTECHTEYDRQCDTRMEQNCFFQSYPVCQSIPRNVCYTQQVCTTQSDQVCNSNGCVRVPRNVCRPVQHCSTRLDQVCHSEQRYVCQTVPRQYCQNIPRQACQQVPNIVKVPYACTRPVQVPIGQQLKLHTTAQVAIQFSNLTETGAISESLKAELKDGTVKLSVIDPAGSAYLFQILDQNRSEQIISSNEKAVNYRFTLKAIPVQKLNSFLNASITQPKLYFDRLEFGFTGSLDAPFKGSLLITQRRHIISDRVVINQEFSPTAIVSRGAIEFIDFSPFGIESLKGSKHEVQLTLKLDAEQLSKGLINPETLSKISGKQVISTFESSPSN